MALQATELRIGNWVSNGEKHYTVDVNMLYDIATFEHCPIEPIPLTPEILEQCGLYLYKLQADNDYSVYEIEEDSYLLSIDWRRRNEGYAPLIYSGELSSIGCNIKYLHQLQNLHFALKGEELTVNL